MFYKFQKSSFLIKHRYPRTRDRESAGVSQLSKTKVQNKVSPTPSDGWNPPEILLAEAQAGQNRQSDNQPGPALQIEQVGEENQINPLIVIPVIGVCFFRMERIKDMNQSR
jgi:hypothetical protein